MVSGLVTKRLLLTLLNGLMRVPVPVALTFQSVPPAPGTYNAPLARAGWNTGSQKSLRLPGAFQSVVTWAACCALRTHCGHSWATASGASNKRHNTKHTFTFIETFLFPLSVVLERDGYGIKGVPSGRKSLPSIMEFIEDSPTEFTPS